RTSVGVQYNSRYTLGLQVSGNGLAPGSEEVTGATNIKGQESITQTVTAGTYIEQKFGWRERLFGTVALRADGSSSFGSNFRTIMFPKGSVSWLLSDEPFFPKWGW